MNTLRKMTKFDTYSSNFLSWDELARVNGDCLGGEVIGVLTKLLVEIVF